MKRITARQMIGALVLAVVAVACQDGPDIASEPELPSIRPNFDNGENGENGENGLCPSETDCSEDTVTPNAGAEIVTPSGRGAAVFPAAAFGDQTVQVSVEIQSGDCDPFPIDGAIGDCLVVTTEPANAQLQKDATLWLCIPSLAHAELATFTDGRIVILENVSATVPQGFDSPTCIVNGSTWNGFINFARGVLKQLLGPVTPQPLYASITLSDQGASHRKLSGGGFSPHQYVDPLDIDRARVKLHNKKPKDGFDVRGAWGSSLGPACQDVMVTFGEGATTFQETVASSAFSRRGGGDDGAPRCVYKAPGNTSGITRLEIFDNGGVKVEAKNLDLSGTVDLGDPERRFVSFILKIGGQTQGAGLYFDKKGSFGTGKDDG